MRKFIVGISITALMVVLLVLTSCGSPEPEPSDLYLKYIEIEGKHTALQNTHNALLFNYEQLEKAKVEYEASLVKCNESDAQHRALLINHGLLEVRYKSMEAYYIKMFKAIAPAEGALEEMNKQYLTLVERSRVIDEQLAAVNAKKVKMVSDNLTASELDIFYRGWNLWWETFNE